MNSYYPPGHPTGTDHKIVTIRCPECETVCTFNHIYERDTNAGYFHEGDPVCECGYAFSDQDLDDDANWEHPADVEPEYEPDYDMGDW